MNNYIGLGILTIILIVCLLIAKKDYKNWYDSDGVQKSFIIKAIIGISILILIMIYKIIKDSNG